MRDALLSAARWLALCACIAAATIPLGAQADVRKVDSQRGAELTLFGGAGTSGAGVGAAFGWSIGWRPDDWIAIEGSGSWTGEPETDGFAALFGPRFYLGGGRVVPFITAEAGLFHASVRASNAEAPDFYQDRIETPIGEKAFNDFVAAGGFGLDLRLSRHVYVRPQVRVLTVVDGWRTHMLALPGVHLSYKFGDPGPTP